MGDFYDADDGMNGGELALLAETLSPQECALSDKSQQGIKCHQDEPSYGEPLSAEKAEEVLLTCKDGLIWHCTVIPDTFYVDGKLTLRGLNKRDFDLETGKIKPRRASLPLTVTDLLSSLTKIEGHDGSPRFIFNGVLNGWPSLRTFELVRLEKKRSIGPLAAPDYLGASKLTWQHFWDVTKEGSQGIPPSIKDDSNKIYRATFRGPDWTSRGWSRDSPGFVFWYESQRESGPRVSYGSNAVDMVDEGRCTHVHMVSHRYAVKKESTKDRVTYHSVVLLEWDHGNYCTVVEGAYLNGIGGYQGRSNWYADRDDNPNGLYAALPPEMISPWLTIAAEIRCYDVEAKNLEEFKVFVNKYQGAANKDLRFLDPRFTFSHPARLTYRSKSHIVQYLLNYIGRDTSYSELKRNCQTLAADLCSFLAGKKNVTPFHPVNRIDYHNRTHLFLYDSEMFERKGLEGKVAR